MAAFYPSFSADSVFSPNDPIKNPTFFEDFFSDFEQIYASLDHPSSIPQQDFSFNNERSCLEQQSRSYDENEPLLIQNQRCESFSSMAEKHENGERVSEFLAPVVDKKRKIHHGSPLTSANFKEVKVKWKKQKGQKEGKKDVKGEKKGENPIEPNEEPPKGYVHVRARRGQATDSHSLAERARREKISQKMKALQALVPGCDKVTGKALMLDEIINYVQSLQNQVEFLSMKLASLNPIVHIFGLTDHESMAYGMEGLNNGIALPLPSMQQASSRNRSLDSSLAFINSSVITKMNPIATTSTFTSPLADGSTSLLHDVLKSTKSVQDARSAYWGLDDPRRQTTINQLGFRANTNTNNLYCF